jgi:hypothetical protein
MHSDPEQPGENPFWFREYFLMPMPLGQKAVNLPELLHFLREADESMLYYQLVQSRLGVTQPVVEYPDEFALWATTALELRDYSTGFH